MDGTRRRVRLLLSLLALLAPACGDDSTTPGGTEGHSSARLSGQVTIAYEDVPLVGARVALVNPFPYQVVAGPVFTDSNGLYAFKDAPAGDWFVFVFGDSVLMLNSDDAAVSIGTYGRVTHDIEMLRSQLWGNGTRQITGTIRDADTGEPIEGAFVSGMFGIVYHSFLGISTDSEDMTDADGRFRVEPVYLLTSGGSVLHPLAVCKDGYAPFALANVPVPMDPDSLYTLDIALERPTSGATVRGRIVDGSGSPVPNLPVALDFSPVPLDSMLATSTGKGGSDPQEVPVLGKSVHTDGNGGFEFVDLAAGTYFVDPGFLPDDGYVFSDEDNYFQVMGTEVSDIGDLAVLPAIRPLSPANGAVVHEARPTVRWQAVAGADRYRLSAGAAHFLDYEVNVTTPEHQFTVDISPGTRLRWHVTAYRTATPFDERIAEFETAPVFTVEE